MAGQTRIGSLHVMLGLDSAQFSSGLDKSTGKLDAFGRDAVKTGNRVEGLFVGMGNAAKAFGTTLVAGLVAGGITAVVSQIGQVATAIASIKDEASRAGIGVEAFQELKYVAEQSRVGVDSLTDGLKELSLRADEFIVTGGGSAAEAFKRLGYDAETLKQKLADPSALFTEIIGKLGQLERAAQIRVADEIFGGQGGEKFVQLIDMGEEGIRSMTQEARNLGLVMSSELVDKAVELDRQFNIVATTVGTALKAAIVNSASALSGFIDQFRALEDRTAIRPLQNQLAGVYDRRYSLAAEIKQIEGEIAALGALNPASMMMSWGLDDKKQQLADLTTEADALLERITQLQGMGTTPPPIIPQTIPTVPGSAAPGGGSRKEAASDAERQAKAIQNLIAGLEFERNLVGLSALDQQKLTALRQAGAGATEEQKLKILELIDATHGEQARIDDLQKAFDMLGQIGMAAIQGITQAFADGKIEGEELLGILGNILGMVGNNFLNNAFSGLSGLFGLGGNAPGIGGFNFQIPQIAAGGSTRLAT